MNEAVNNSAPVVFLREASWNEINVAHYRFRAGELPEHHNAAHLITFSLSEDCGGEISTADGFSTCDRNRGNVCVVPAGQPYRVRLDTESEHLAIFLDPALVLRAGAESVGSSNAQVMLSCVPGDPVISSVALALLAEIESEGPGGRLYTESLANILAVHLLRHYSLTGNGRRRFVGGLSGKKLAQVLSFIGDNYDRDLSIEELAGVADMSRFHFAREFKRATGQTPHQYLLKFRIDRAKEMLTKSKLSLVEVSFRSGFSHQSHFTRLFRRITGTTPQSYRLMLQT